MPTKATISALVTLLVVVLGLYVEWSGGASSTPIVPAVTPTSEQVASSTELSRVVRVVDGDTVVVHLHGATTTLRLIGLNTPEVVDPRRTVQCFGKEASNKAKELLTGASVRVELDPSQGTYDKYGRTLAYVFLADGTLFNKLMISEGYGYEYTYNVPYVYQTAFKQAQKSAQELGKGLWAEGVCVK